MSHHRDPIAERLLPDPETSTAPKVTTIEEAEFWIGVMHRRTLQDAERLFVIEEKMRRMPKRWRRRWEKMR